MSRATVRAAIAAWLAPPAVAGINTVYSDLPALIPGEAFFAGSVGATSGCVAALHIAGENESRKALGGATSGKKRVDYRLEVRLFYRSIVVPAAGGDAGLIAGAEFDAIVEALKARIRADRTAGSAAVWQWGETDLSVDSGELTQSAAGLELWAAVYTEVTEWITS